MPFIADDLGAWLIGMLADATRRKLIALVLGSDQERALRQAAKAAVWLTARELRPDDSERAEELAMVISQVFSETVPTARWSARTTLLAAVREGVAAHLAVLDDEDLTGTGWSSAEVLGLSAATVSEALAGHLMREIVVRGSTGGPLGPLAAQLNHDVTHLRGQRIEDNLSQLADQVWEAISRLESSGQLAPASSLEVKCSLPPDTAAFTGRGHELNRITNALADVAGTGRVVAIGGMPGVGKSALAVHAGNLLRRRFPDRQLFIDLRGYTPGQTPVSAEVALARLLRATGVDPRFLPEDQDGRAALWRDRMATQQALLILDNAATSEQVIPLLPGGERCLVLVTSRRHLADLPGAVVPVLLQALPPGQAREMFLRLAPRAAADPPETVAALTRLAGFLPLAISLLARVYSSHPSWTLADLTAETEAGMLTMRPEKDTVAAAFQVSYKHLKPGQRALFRRIGLHPGTTTDAYAAAALAGCGCRKADRYLNALHREGLLTDAGYPRYSMHDLIRRYARDRAADEPSAVREQALERLLDYYQHAAQTADRRITRYTRPAPAPVAAVSPATVPGQAGPSPPKLGEPGGAIPDLSDSTRALAWARAERANLLACLDYAAQAGEHARVAALSAGLAGLLWHDGPWPDAVRRHGTAVQAARQLGNRLAEASALHDQGAVQWVAGNHQDSVQVLKEALAIYCDLGNQLGRANALNSLGTVQYVTSDYNSAEVSLQEALAIYRSASDRLGQVSALTSLGGVWYLTGRYPDSAGMLEEALAIARALDDLRGTATALTFLGSVHYLTGAFREAAEVMEEALSVYRDLGDRRGLAMALISVGAVRQKTGDYRAAAEAAEEALGISRDLADRVGQANALCYLGTARCEAGSYDAAAQALEEALGIFGELGNQRGRANALNYLGTVRCRMGDYPRAAEMLEQALSIYRSLHDQGGEAEVLNEMGTLHWMRGESDRCGEYHRQALSLAQAIGSPWDEAQALAGLGRHERATGHTERAAATLRQAQEIFRQIGAVEPSLIAEELESHHRAATGPPQSRSLIRVSRRPLFGCSWTVRTAAPAATTSLRKLLSHIWHRRDPAETGNDLTGS